MFSSAPARRLPFLSRLSTVAAVLAFLGTGGPSPAAETPAPRWSVGSRHVIPADAATGPSLEIEYRSASESIWTKSPAEAGEAGATWLVPDLKPGRYFLRAVGAKTESNVDIIPSQRADYHWVSIQPAAPFAARDGAGALTLNGKMWLLGGWRPSGDKTFPRKCSNDVWSSVDGKNWKMVKPNTFLDASFDASQDWEGRHTAGYVVHENKLWIVGGDPLQGHYQPDVWSSADGKTWKHVNAGTPAPWGQRALAYTVAHDGYIWVIGGQTMPEFAPSEERFFRDVWRSKDGIAWEEVKPAEPFWSARGMIGGAAVMNGRIWILGGGTYDTPTTKTRKFFNDVWSSADGVRWQQHTQQAPWAPRQYHDVAVFDGKLWVMGGYSGQNRKDVWYSSDGVNWYEQTKTPWKPRHAASVFVHDDSVWMVAGNNMESDVWRLRTSDAAAASAAARLPEPGWTAPTDVPGVTEALASKSDLWGELSMRQPDGPTYAFFERLLPALRYVEASFRHYPIALAAPYGPKKARFVSNGSAVNINSTAPPPGRWWQFPLGLTFHVGDDDEPFGADVARLEGPTYAGGYIPIVRNQYRQGGVTIAQEAFAPTDAPFADHAAVLLRFALAGDAAEPTRLAVQLQGGAGLALKDGVLANPKGQALAWIGPGWTHDAAGTRLAAELRPGHPLTLGVFSAPLDKPSLGTLDSAEYERLCASTAATWERHVTGCMKVEIPEERVNRAWKAVVVANLMMATGDEMSYSSGNAYHRLYEAEAGDAMRALLTYGLLDTAKAMTNPFLRYKQAGLAYHDAGFKLQLLSHVYWLTRDAQFVRNRRDLWRPTVERIINDREKPGGLLPKENYAGDIDTQVYSLNSNANSWRGLRDIAAVLRDIGDREEAETIAAVAAEFRTAIDAAIDKSEFRDVEPPFIPVALFGAEKPYDTITASVTGSYWNLLIPYVLGSGILDERRTRATLEYLHTRGGVAMGMMRFHQHSGLFANENGVDDLYTLRYVQTLLLRDDVDRALVSFYGKLAQGFTRDTFVGGEGTSLVPLDAHGRPMYLPPNAAGNALFLTTLRELLVQDQDLDKDGTPETLRLLFATPRAWLEDGRTIRLEGAPTAFGKVSVVATSALAKGEVTVDVMPPERAPASARLRLRLPGGWSVTSAWISDDKLHIGDDGAVDVSTRREPFKLRFGVTRK